MKRLYVLYDGTAIVPALPDVARRSSRPLCRWFSSRCNRPKSACRFPGIEALHPEREIVVISDTGDVWQGGSAWVMCLWALREYREWSQRLAHPALLPLPGGPCELVSENRHQGSAAGLPTASTTAEELRERLGTASRAIDLRARQATANRAEMKIVIPGGSGQVGTLLARAFHGEGHEVVVLSRAPRAAPWTRGALGRSDARRLVGASWTAPTW